MNSKPRQRFLWPLHRNTARLEVSGDTHGRSLGTTLARRSLCGVFGFVLPLSLSTIGTAHALPPLVKAADLAQPNIEAFWREPGFLVCVPSQPGLPGQMPLEDSRPLQLPKDLESWTVIGQSCQAQPRHHTRLAGVPIEAAVSGDAIHPTVQLWMGGRPVAEALLGRPAKVCEIQIIEADAIQGLEIVVAWRLSNDQALRGFTIYRVPESLDPTPAGPPE